MEGEDKGYGYAESEAGEDEPCCLPIAQKVITLPNTIVFHYFAGGQCADSGTKSVGHQHEQALCWSAHAGLALLVYKEAARYVEEVEGYAINYAGEDKQDDAGHGRVAQAEETEAEHPSEHGDEHHGLDAEALQEEGD